VYGRNDGVRLLMRQTDGGVHLTVARHDNDRLLLLLLLQLLATCHRPVPHCSASARKLHRTLHAQSDNCQLSQMDPRDGSVL